MAPGLSFPTKGDYPWLLPTQQLQDWTELYPWLNVQQEIHKALAWVQANPSRRKTARGMPRFLVAWLNRAAPAPKSSQARLDYEAWKQAGGCPHVPRCPHFTACQVVSWRLGR